MKSISQSPLEELEVVCITRFNSVGDPPQLAA